MGTWLVVSCRDRELAVRQFDAGPDHLDAGGRFGEEVRHRVLNGCLSLTRSRMASCWWHHSLLAGLGEYPRVYPWFDADKRQSDSPQHPAGHCRVGGICRERFASPGLGFWFPDMRRSR